MSARNRGGMRRAVDGEKGMAEDISAARLTPAEAAAETMVGRLLVQMPGFAGDARRDGVVIAIEVPGPAWVDPVAEAWRKLVLQSEDVPDDTDDVDDDPRQRTPLAAGWAEVRRDGKTKAHTPKEGNGGIALALACGKAVYGFAPAPEQHLPADLLRAADHRITIPRPDADAIAEILLAMLGQRPAGQFPTDLARLVDIDDLCLARRPGEDADSCLERLRKLVEVRNPPPQLTLDCLHGMDEAVAWGSALARDLADFRSGKLPWSAVDRGALLYGPPGTGKTTFAKALAGTCSVPLIAASLNQWQAAGTGHLGDLLKAMADTFRSAKAAAPAILFVDEVDGFGDRESFRSDYKDYSIQVVNAFLEHLDGVAGREGVVVIAACNHPDRLDPAIVRSGRLDRTIAIPLPDRSALSKILRHHLGGDLATTDLSYAATLAQGSTGADCERWVRGARRRARHQGRPVVVDDLLSEIRGTSMSLPREWRYCYAVHEAGHAVAVLDDRPGDLTMVTVRQTATTGGGIMATIDDKRPVTRDEMARKLVRLLAGRAAEEVVLGDVTAGAGGSENSDLGRATVLATISVTALGLGGDGSLLWQGLPDQDSVGSMLALRPDVARAVRGMLAEAYDQAKACVARNQGLVELIATQLVEHETLDGDDVRALAAQAVAKATA